MNTILGILLILTILILSAKIAKVIFKKDTYLGALILLKTNKLTQFIISLGKYKKTLDFISKLGLVIGFGAFGFDYITKNKKFKKNNKLIKIIIFIIVTVILTFLTYISAGDMFLRNPLIPKGISYFIIALTGLMGLSGFTLGSLIFSTYDIITKLFIGQNACPGIGLVIPGVKMPKVNFFVPWYGWLILIFSAMIHEFFHGALLKRFNLKIKSVGVILAGILPLGAFVEPDEKELKKTNKDKVAQMYSAGPTSNFFIAIVFFIILLIVNPLTSGYFSNIDSQRDLGIKVITVNEKTNICGSEFNNPAYGILKKNDLILSINNTIIKTNKDYKTALTTQGINTFVIRNLDTNLVRTEYIKTNELGNIGFDAEMILNKNYKTPKNYFFLKGLLSVFNWIALLNFLISSVNFLPTVPFDGGFLSQVIFERYLNKKNNINKRMKKVSKFFGIIIIILLLLNIIPYFF